MSVYSLYSDAKFQSALSAIGAGGMGQQEVDLLKQIFVAAGNSSGGGGGGSPISDPNVAYIRSDGNDGTGEVGNPAKPYLTAQAAYDDGARVFDVGVVNVEGFPGTLVIAQNLGAQSISLRGAGQQFSAITIDNTGEGGASGLDSTTPGEQGGAGGSGDDAVALTITSDKTVLVSLTVRPGGGGSGGSGGPGDDSDPENIIEPGGQGAGGDAGYNIGTQIYRNVAFDEVISEIINGGGGVPPGADFDPSVLSPATMTFDMCSINDMSRQYCPATYYGTRAATDFYTKEPV